MRIISYAFMAATFCFLILIGINVYDWFYTEIPWREGDFYRVMLTSICGFFLFLGAALVTYRKQRLRRKNDDG